MVTSRGVNRRSIFPATLATLAFVALINLGFALANLRVATIKIEGLKIAPLETVVNLVSQQLGQQRWWLLPQQVVLFFDTGRVRRVLEHQFPFATWSVSKEVSGMVNIAAEERVVALLWVSAGSVHYLDATGEAFAAADLPQPSAGISNGMEVIRHQALGQGVPAVADERNRRVAIGDWPLLQPAVQFIREVATALQTGAVKPPPAVTGWRYDADRYQLTAETLDGYEIYFASNQSAADQLGKLAAALQQGIAKRPGLQYIDVRFGQKIFYQHDQSGQ